MDKVSIIIPVYNVDIYLRKCLDSCIQQSYTNIEILAIDDGSSDLSTMILDEYALTEIRLKVFHQSNKGVVSARNKGIENATGEWLMFVDSDDFLPINAVEALYNAVNNSKSLIGIGSILNAYYNGKIVSVSNSLPYGFTKMGIASALLMEKLHFSLCGKIFFKKLFDNLLVYPELKIGEDAFLTIQLCHQVDKIEIIDTPVYYYVQRNNSVTHSPSRSAVNSRLQFVYYTINFYSDKEYCENPSFQSSLYRFIMNEIFSFLRMGGNYNSICKELRQKIENECLNDEAACHSLPFWRIVMLKAYKLSPVIGRVIKEMINLSRIMIKKMQSF